MFLIAGIQVLDGTVDQENVIDTTSKKSFQEVFVSGKANEPTKT
jgi:hypothetical protein